MNMKLVSIVKLKELLFSKRNDDIQSIGQCNKLTKEFIKIMEMYDKDPDDVKHWIDGLNSCILNCYPISDTGYKNMLSKILYNSVSDKSIIELINDDHGNNFINRIKSEVQSKYRKYIPSMNSFQYDNEYYIRLLGILYLILVGRESVDNIDLSYVWDRKFDKIKISPKDKNVIKPGESKLILSKYIYHLNGDQGVLSTFL